LFFEFLRMKLREQVNILARRMRLSDESCNKPSVIPPAPAERAGGDVGRWQKAGRVNSRKRNFLKR